MKLNLIYQTNRCVAIEKPAGLAAIPGRGETTSALQLLAEQLGIPCTGTADPRVRVVHRLDKDTSGVMLFALDSDAQRHLSHQFQNNKAQKEYLALVCSVPTTDEGVIEAPIGPHPLDKKRMTVIKSGKPALTHWKIEQKFRQYALLRVFPKTGKTHQIRVHMKHIGHPLAIDEIYNPGTKSLLLSSLKRNYKVKKGEEERPLIARLTLHAQKLTIVPPGEDLSMTIESPIPKDIRTMLNMLEKWGR